MRSKATPTFLLLLGELTEAADGSADGSVVRGRLNEGAANDGLTAGVAAPDSDGLTAAGELTAEGAEVLGVLGNFELAGALTGVGTVAGAVASHDAHLSSALGHIDPV